MTRLDETTIGKLFVDKDGNYWRHVSYCDRPTATVEQIDRPLRCGGAVGSPILNELELRLLVPEDSAA